MVNSEALGPAVQDRSPAIPTARKHIRKGLETARELYGSGGYFEFTAYPDLQPRDA